MRRLAFFGFLGLILVGGMLLWGVSWRGVVPFSLAQGELPSISAPEDLAALDIQKNLQQIDHQIAETIREWSTNGIEFPWNSLVDQASQATVSAQLQTSPQELWTTFREQGSQAVLSSLAKSTEVTVQGVSSDVINQARYQYCLGVVETFQSRDASTSGDATGASAASTQAQP